ALLRRVPQVRLSTWVLGSPSSSHFTKNCHPDRSGPTLSSAPNCGASGRAAEGSCHPSTATSTSFTLSLFHFLLFALLRRVPQVRLSTWVLGSSSSSHFTKTCHPDRSGPTLSSAPNCGASGRAAEGSWHPSTATSTSVTLSLFHFLLFALLRRVPQVRFFTWVLGSSSSSHFTKTCHPDRICFFFSLFSVLSVSGAYPDPVGATSVFVLCFFASLLLLPLLHPPPNLPNHPQHHLRIRLAHGHPP